MAILLPVKSTEQIRDLAALASTVWNEYFPVIIGQAQVDYMVDKFQSRAALSNQLAEGYEYFFIRHDGIHAGYVGLLTKADPPVLQISKFYLLKEYRGQGIARQVMRLIAEIAVGKNCQHLYLTVNKNNLDTIRAYEKLGFTRTGALEMDIGSGFIMDDYEMEKDLGSV